MSFWLALPALLACWRAARRDYPVGRALLAGPVAGLARKQLAPGLVGSLG